jgi:hypothetical protein
VASPSCSALTSGTYRLLANAPATEGDVAMETVVLDAATGLVAATVDPDPVSIEPLPGSPCRYGVEGLDGELVVSPAGVGVLRAAVEGQAEPRLVIMIPEQSHPVSALAGDWSLVSFELDDAGTSSSARAALATLSSTGQFTALSTCPDMVNCSPVAGATLSVAPAPDGGFTILDDGSAEDRLFAYQAPNGEMMLASIASNGSIGLWTRRKEVALSPVGTSLASWSVQANRSGAVAPITENSFTNTAFDPATKTLTRVSDQDGHAQTLRLDDPRTGFFTRDQANAPNSSGGTTAVAALVGLQLQGMGVNVSTLPAVPGATYLVTVSRP